MGVWGSWVDAEVVFQSGLWVRYAARYRGALGIFPSCGAFGSGDLELHDWKTACVLEVEQVHTGNVFRWIELRNGWDGEFAESGDTV
jgi:hypothetical protein